MRREQFRLCRPITEDEVKTYQNLGVVLLRGVFDLQAINALRGAIDRSVKTLGESKSGYDFTELARAYENQDEAVIAANSGGQHNIGAIVGYLRHQNASLLRDQQADGGGHFYVDTDLSARIREIRSFSMSQAAGEIAAALLKSDQVRLFGDQLFVKEPGTRERTAFHQDASFFPIDGEQCCVFWIPVDPVTEEIGAMQYVRGSHRSHTVFKPNVFVSQTELPGSEGVRLPDIEGNPDLYDIVSFDVEPGDIIVHHYRTIHGAGGNRSRYQVRRALSVRYCGDDIRGVERPWVPSRPDINTNVKPGEAISGPDFPVVWQRRHATEAAA